MKKSKLLIGLFGLLASYAYADVDIYLNNPISETTVDGKVIYRFSTETVLNRTMCNNTQATVLNLKLIVRPYEGWSTASYFDGKRLNPTANPQIFYQYDAISANDNSFTITPSEREKTWVHSYYTAGLGLEIRNPTVVYQPSINSDILFRDGKFTLPRMNIMYIDYTCHRLLSNTPVGGGHINIWIGDFDIKPPIKKTCKLTSAQDQVVSLRQAAVANLRRDNEIPAGNFSLNLDCERNTSVEAVYVAFTDANNKSNTSNILSLDSNSTAKGVGLKIYPQTSGTAIKFNPNAESSISLNKSDAYLMNLDRSSGLANENYSVSYVKTNDSTLSAGTVQGKMTFNFYYQ